MFIWQAINKVVAYLLVHSDLCDSNEAHWLLWFIIGVLRSLMSDRLRHEVAIQKYV